MQKVNMSKGANNEFLRIIAHLLEDPYNRVCADCQCKPSKWASTTLGVFICIECSGVHRSLGTHISFVRSCTLDEWSLPQVRLMQAIGNRLANIYWEKNLPSDFERPGPANRSLMQLFIKQKYALKKWADFGPPPHIVFQTLPIENQEAVAERRSRPRSRRERKEKKPLQFNRTEEKEVVIAERAKEETLDEFFEDAPKRSVPKPVKPHQPKRVEMPNQNPQTVGELEHVIDDFFKAEMEANLGLEVKKTAPKSVSMDSMGQAGERANVQKLKQFFGHEQPVPVPTPAAEEEEASGNGEEESEEKESGKMPTLNLMNVEFESIPDVTDTAGLESFFDAEEPDHSVKIEELSRKLEVTAEAGTVEQAAAEVKQEQNLPVEEQMQEVAADVEEQVQDACETAEEETNDVTGNGEEEAIQEEEEQEEIQEEEEPQEQVKKNTFDFLNVEFESMPVAADTADLESFFSDGGDGYDNLDEPVPVALAKPDHEIQTGEPNHGQPAEHPEEEAANERPTMELQVTKCVENELKPEDKQPLEEQPEPVIQQDLEQPEKPQEQSELVIQQEPEQPKESTEREEIQNPSPEPEKPKLRFSFVTTNLVHVESSIPPQPPAQQKKPDKVKIEAPQSSGFDPNADPFLNPELDLESFFEAPKPKPSGRPMSAPSSDAVSESQLDNLIDDFFGDAQGSAPKTKPTSSSRKPTTSQTSDSNTAKPEPKVKSMTLMAVQKRKAKEERESRRERGHHHHHRHREVEPPQPAPAVPKKVLTFESDDDEEEPKVEVAQPQKPSLAPPGAKKPGATPPLRMQKRMEAEEAMRKRSSHRRHRTNR